LNADALKVLSTDKAELEAVLALERKGVEINRGDLELLALGMTEFRNGHFAAAERTLLSAPKAGQGKLLR
jgi:hypothetical protein